MFSYGSGLSRQPLEAEFDTQRSNSGEGVLDRLARDLRQAADADELVGEQLDVAVNDLVAFLNEPVNRTRWFVARHHLEWSR